MFMFEERIRNQTEIEEIVESTFFFAICSCCIVLNNLFDFAAIC